MKTKPTQITTPAFTEDPDNYNDGWSQAFNLVRESGKPMRVIITEAGWENDDRLRPGSNLYKLFPSGRSDFIRRVPSAPVALRA